MVGFLWRSTLFIFLNALTQVGGLIFLISLLLAKRWKTPFRLKTLLIFTITYLASTYILIPHSAHLLGRETIKHEYAKPTNYGTVLLNRNYVKPELNKVLEEVKTTLGSAVQISYLDANFPFFDRFPLLPHLSHNDGKKLDLSLVYESVDGTISNKQKSRSGYGVFEGPQGNEVNQIAKCKEAGYFQYDYPKYLTFGEINEDLQFSEKGTKLLAETLLKLDAIEKIFIEPHLKKRLNLDHPKIRYHGCGAVRHDDHIHIQIK